MLILNDVFKANDTDRTKERQRIEEQIASNQKRIDSLSDKYFDGLVDDATYRDTKRRYENANSELIQKHISLQPEGTAFNNYLRFSIHCCGNLSRVYKRADFVGKRQIIGSIFPDNLVFEEKIIEPPESMRPFS